MKNIVFVLLAFACLHKGNAQTKAPYDSLLAKKLGADNYGMKKYVMAFLINGTPLKDSAKRVETQKAHLRNIQRLADEKKLIVAGPFLDKGTSAGIFIFNVATIDEAKQLTETDPAVKAGVLKFELRPFYCTAALMEIPETHKKLEKKNVAD